MLTVMDEFTHEDLAIAVDTSTSAERVIVCYSSWLPLTAPRRTCAATTDRNSLLWLCKPV